MCSSGNARTRWVARRRAGGVGGGAAPGFVLMEAVIALAIIGVFAVALLSTTGTQLQTAAKANSLLVARSLAEDRLASLRLLDYEDLGDVPDSLLEGTFPPPFEDYRWTARVEEMEDEYDLFGAEVVVSGRGETFPLRTLLHVPRPNVQVTDQGGLASGPGGLSGTPGAAGRGAPGAGRGREPTGAGDAPPAAGRGGRAGRGGQVGGAAGTGRGQTAGRGRGGTVGAGS